MTLRFPAFQGLVFGKDRLPSARIVEDANHVPVMAREVFEALQLKAGDIYADGTLGLGGHSLMAAERVAPGGQVVAVDWDESMLAIARERLAAADPTVKITLQHEDFRGLDKVLESRELFANGILLDLGLNSAQVDDPSRGMSFLAEGPLDMRMDRTRGEPAAALLNRLSPFEIESILFDFGDERWARAIAKAIVERRRSEPLRTTTDLVESVNAAVPAGARETRIHPATRTFQAVRIAVNRELEGLGEAVVALAGRLAPQGTLVVLSYHSGEDRIVKLAFKELEGRGFASLSKKPIQPTAQEISTNRRSRSARMRAIRFGSSTGPVRKER